MKTSFFALLATLVLSTQALAAPGSSSLTCRSAAGAKQVVQLEVARSSTTGEVTPTVKLSLDGKNYPISTPNIRKQYGQTIHDAALGVIVVTVRTESQKNSLYVQVMAVPGTVKAFDQDGNPVPAYDVKNDDGGECIDGYGKATFKGVLTGGFSEDPSSSKGAALQDSQIMDCELDYDTGSAC